MKQGLSGPALIGAITVAVISLIAVGYFYLSGPRAGEKPKLHPSLERMYGSHVGGFTPPQNQASTSEQNR